MTDDTSNVEVISNSWQRPAIDEKWSTIATFDNLDLIIKCHKLISVQKLLYYTPTAKITLTEGDTLSIKIKIPTQYMGPAGPSVNLAWIYTIKEQLTTCMANGSSICIITDKGCFNYDIDPDLHIHCGFLSIDFNHEIMGMENGATICKIGYGLCLECDELQLMMLDDCTETAIRETLNVETSVCLEYSVEDEIPTT